MKITICDICGKGMPSTKYPDAIRDLNFCISSQGKIWDVCDQCREELNKWMKKRKAESEGSNDKT